MVKTTVPQSALLLLRALLESALAVALAQTSRPETPSNPAALVWSDEFNGPAQSQPDPTNWTYDVGNSGWGNQELETYCAWASNTPPCSAANPSAYVGGDGYLHIVARDLGKGVYTSARLKTQGLQSFQYGRIEARIKIPEGQGIWPAFWMLGDNITTVDWPACGEIDIMENIGKEPSIYHGSLHMTGGDLTKKYTLPNGEKLASAFHIYGMIWTPGIIQFYIDTPTNIYATFTPADLPKTAHLALRWRQILLHPQRRRRRKLARQSRRHHQLSPGDARRLRPRLCSARRSAR